MNGVVVVAGIETVPWPNSMGSCSPSWCRWCLCWLSNLPSTESPVWLHSLRALNKLITLDPCQTGGCTDSFTGLTGLPIDYVTCKYLTWKTQRGCCLGVICVQPMAIMWCSVSSVGIQGSMDQVEGGEASFTIVYSGPMAEVWLCVQLETLLERSSGSRGGASSPTEEHRRVPHNPTLQPPPAHFWILIPVVQKEMWTYDGGRV